jgi:hypothetical protein
MSRRILLQSFGAGAAAVAATPVLLPGTRSCAATAAKAGLPPAATTLAGLHGATLLLAAFPAGTTWAEAIADWEGYTGTTIKASKAYYGPGVFPTSIKSNGEIRTFISNGIKALLSFKPAFNPPTKADLAALENTLQMYQSAGLAATVTFWQEPQNAMTASQFHQVFQYYGPTVRKYYPLAYNADASHGPASWTKYYPGASLVDVVAIDYYATTYLNGITLETIVALADNASPAKPFGIWEMGSTNSKETSDAKPDRQLLQLHPVADGRPSPGWEGQCRNRLVQRRRHQHDHLQLRLPRAPLGRSRHRHQLITVRLRPPAWAEVLATAQGAVRRRLAGRQPGLLRYLRVVAL